MTPFHHPAPRFEAGFSLDGFGFFSSWANMGRKAELAQDVADFVVVIPFVQTHPLRVVLGRLWTLDDDALDRRTQQFHIVARIENLGTRDITSLQVEAKLENESTISGPAAALETLNLDDVKPAAELPVPDKDVVTASFATFDGLTVDLRLMERDKADWVAISATGSGLAEAEAKKIEGKVSHWTYAIPAYKANLLKTKLADLVEPPKGS